MKYDVIVIGAGSSGCGPPTLYQDVETLFAQDGEPELVLTEKGHGRLERREVRTSGELEGYSDFPGLKQVVEVKKKVVRLKTGEVSQSTHYRITSLCAEEAGPEGLLRLMRGHWRIENRLFHVKDDGFGEDRQVFQSHQSGTVPSLLRATALNLLRAAASCGSPPSLLPGVRSGLALNLWLSSRVSPDFEKALVERAKIWL